MKTHSTCTCTEPTSTEQKEKRSRSNSVAQKLRLQTLQVVAFTHFEVKIGLYGTTLV